MVQFKKTELIASEALGDTCTVRQQCSRYLCQWLRIRSTNIHEVCFYSLVYTVTESILFDSVVDG